MFSGNPNFFRRAISALAAAITGLSALPAHAADGTVQTDALILRAIASKDGKALQTLDRGTTLDIRSATGDWYKVVYGSYTGYVMKKYVETDADLADAANTQAAETDAGMKGISAISDIGGAPATSAPGDSGTKVKKLQQALKLKGCYSSAIDGDYGEKTESAVKKFQKANGMSQDGIAGKVTIELLFGEKAQNDAKSSDAKEYKTERLDWFHGGADVIPKGATFTVKDCKTGKTFTVKRWSGANHLDGEPLTKDDTATLKAVYGGAWSWRRRAILVKYDGHVYAASMNGMPHGTTTIDGNGFDGHFCIHFYGSKTHGTKKVDAAHQTCVAQAMKYTW